MSDAVDEGPTREMTPGVAVGSLAAFAVVWATATLIHLLSFHFWAQSWQGWLLLLCVGLVLLRPESPVRFLAMVAASLVNLGRSLPFVPNHILFEGLVNLTILLAAAPVVWRRRAEIRASLAERAILVPVVAVIVYVLVLMWFLVVPDIGGVLTAVMIVGLHRRPAPVVDLDSVGRDVWSSLAGVLRWEVAVMYWWAVVQKLNHDYLASPVGCPLELQHQIEALLGLPSSPAWLGPPLAWGSLAVEAGIPLLLLFRRTRVAGFVLAIVFHLWLALVPHPGVYSFTALVLSLLFVFLPAERIARLRTIWAGWRRRVPGPREVGPGAVIVTFFVLGITSSVLYSTLGHEPGTFAIVNTIGLVACLLWGVWLSFGYLACWWTGSAGGVEPSNGLLPGLRWTPAWLGLVLVVLNGMCPWIGAKTQTSFAMFSNLRTEFAPNHLFLERVDLFPYQREMVEVLASDPDVLVPGERPRSIEHMANPGRILPFFELRRILSRHSGDVRMTIRRGGPDGPIEVVERIDGIASPPEAFEPPTFLESKLLWFRRHGEWTGAMPCTH